MQSRPATAIVLTGGGARAAYQVGFLRYLARICPDFRFEILSGVSAGAINAAFLAQSSDDLGKSADDLTKIWLDLTPDKVFRADFLSLTSHVARWGLRLLTGGAGIAPTVHGLMDTSPLNELLKRTLHCAPSGEMEGVALNLANPNTRLKALALATIDWGTGRTVTWVQAQERIPLWQRAGREARRCRMTLAHVMASSALPLLFPAIGIGDSWYGDGGVRLAFPLAPSIHLGADRIIAISTRSTTGNRSSDITGYPPPAQVAGVLLNSVFLDHLDQDAERLSSLNYLLAGNPQPPAGQALRPIEMLLVRPSQDLGRLAALYEPKLPGALRFLTRGLGTKQTASPDLVAMLLFQADYVQALIEIGEHDAEQRKDELLTFLC